VIDQTAFIHATADIEPDVTIGPGTAVWHRAQVRSGTRIGRDGVIGRDVFIDEGVTIGDRVKVQNGALIYHGATIGDGVFIGPGAILTNDRRPRAQNASGGLARAADWTVSPIVVESGASIGAGAIVVAGCAIGPWAMIGAGAIVTRTVPGHALMVGNPARQRGWVCICAAGLHPAPAVLLTCPACGRRYAPDSPTLRELVPA
jgi:acetyltransferase-like isoleucine patch superfamily enzyme